MSTNVDHPPMKIRLPMHKLRPINFPTQQTPVIESETDENEDEDENDEEIARIQQMVRAWSAQQKRMKRIEPKMRQDDGSLKVSTTVACKDPEKQKQSIIAISPRGKVEAEPRNDLIEASTNHNDQAFSIEANSASQDFRATELPIQGNKTTEVSSPNTTKPDQDEPVVPAQEYMLEQSQTERNAPRGVTSARIRNPATRRPQSQTLTSIASSSESESAIRLSRPAPPDSGRSMVLTAVQPSSEDRNDIAVAEDQTFSSGVTSNEPKRKSKLRERVHKETNKPVKTEQDLNKGPEPTTELPVDRKRSIIHSPTIKPDSIQSLSEMSSGLYTSDPNATVQLSAAVVPTRRRSIAPERAAHLTPNIIHREEKTLPVEPLVRSEDLKQNNDNPHTAVPVEVPTVPMRQNVLAQIQPPMAPVRKTSIRPLSEQHERDSVLPQNPIGTFDATLHLLKTNELRTQESHLEQLCANRPIIPERPSRMNSAKRTDRISSAVSTMKPSELDAKHYSLDMVTSSSDPIFFAAAHNEPLHPPVPPSRRNTMSFTVDSEIMEDQQKRHSKMLQKLNSASRMSLPSARSSTSSLKLKSSAAVMPKASLHLLKNALSHTLLPGPLNASALESVLKILTDSNNAQFHFVLLLRDTQNHAFRGLYTYDVAEDALFLSYGNGPSRIGRDYVVEFYKYDSGRRAFLPVLTRGFVGSICAVAIGKFGKSALL